MPFVIDEIGVEVDIAEVIEQIANTLLETAQRLRQAPFSSVALDLKWSALALTELNSAAALLQAGDVEQCLLILKSIQMPFPFNDHQEADCDA
jgi:hypothetical protein